MRTAVAERVPTPSSYAVRQPTATVYRFATIDASQAPMASRVETRGFGGPTSTGILDGVALGFRVVEAVRLGTRERVGDDEYDGEAESEPESDDDEDSDADGEIDAELEAVPVRDALRDTEGVGERVREGETDREVLGVGLRDFERDVDAVAVSVFDEATDCEGAAVSVEVRDADLDAVADKDADADGESEAVVVSLPVPVTDAVAVRVEELLAEDGVEPLRLRDGVMERVREVLRLTDGVAVVVPVEVDVRVVVVDAARRAKG